ncbi:hypothetical protein Pyrde_0743 [Pyrodictium delaneyi]|uniref:Flagellin n=1 Tax=Pyrodictium delaneyi TaxID=1273541 RepID=A0A0N7JCZ8_9CREN|nr:hypothetical protein [Pyrodictium delaneyi]ALL00793.1 hypothetical protein Pyrde_0743 [Pyrodictium delaneyi]OWJ55571.1 hypothetical protein Pdsh_01935 [Pyrodictium delaneyi]
MRQHLRGISELTSAALLALIVISIGGLVVIRVIESIQTGIQEATNQLIEAEMSLRQALGVTAAYIDSLGNLIVVLVSGDFPVKLQDVYINDTLWSSQCRAASAGRTGPIEGFVVQPYSIVVITCSVGAASYADVKIVYEGGSVATRAQPV